MESEIHLSEKQKNTLQEAGFNISTFKQILEMDDEDDRSFSKAIVEEYLNQARDKIKEMKELIMKRSLSELSSQGHFLKGSSATVGCENFKNACEKIQHLGAGKDESGKMDIDDENTSLEKIDSLLGNMELELGRVRTALKTVYPNLQE
ncbi:putative multistep phosphorelay regulator 1 [Kalaharituber pfeilii]|nr:putative multistep phosphorelay regulator 1 [Kalaharituber pfeilii]